MKQKLNNLIKNTELQNKKIFLFGNSFMTYEALKIFSNNQVHVTGVIAMAHEVNALKQIYGIPLYTYEQFCLEYVRDAIVFMDARDYKIFQISLNDYGYRINKSLFVNYTKTKRIRLLVYKIWQIIYTVRKFPQKIRIRAVHFYGSIKNYLKYCREGILVYKGMKVYNKIQKKFKNPVPLLVYDYSGLGDVYVLSSLLAGNKEKIFDGDFILTVIGKASAKVAQLFEISNVEVLSDKESFHLMHWIKVCGNENKAYAITPFSRVMYTEIISNSLAGCKINMLDMYKYLFLGLQQEDKVKYPHKKINEKEIEKIFLENKLKPEKTVILSPYANTVIGFPTEFWIGLASKLKEKGYCVCTNCSGDEKEIMGTIRLSVGLDIVEAVLNEAGYLIAMRSGFCDIVSNSDAYKIIIYPLYYLFNSDVYEFCSLKKMGIGKNYTEIQWRYERYDELAECILKRFA